MFYKLIEKRRMVYFTRLYGEGYHTLYRAER